MVGIDNRAVFSFFYLSTTMKKENQKYSYSEVNCNLSVSNHTGEWIRIYNEMQTLWKDIISIVDIEQGDTLAFNELEKKFTPHFPALRESILQGISDSIYSSLIIVV